MELLGGKIDRRLPQTILSDRKKVGAKISYQDPAVFQFAQVANFEPKSGRWATFRWDKHRYWTLDSRRWEVGECSSQCLMIFGEKKWNFLKIFWKFLRSKNFENFHWKLYENEKNWDRKILIFSDPQKMCTLWGPKLTQLLEILMELLRIKTRWKLCFSTLRKTMVSLCSGARKTMKSYYYFFWSAKPMNTTRNVLSFVKWHSVISATRLHHRKWVSSKSFKL